MCTCIFLLIFDKRKNCEEPDYCYIPTSLSLLYISIYNTLILTTLFFKGKYYDIVLIVIRYLWTCYLTLCGLYYYEIINIIVTNYIM